MTFPSSGAISAATINTQFSRAAGTPVQSSDIVIRSVGSVTAVGTPFSYSNLYGNSPNWTMYPTTTGDEVASAGGTQLLSSANGSSVVQVFANYSTASNATFAMLTRYYLNGGIITRKTATFNSEVDSGVTDASDNIYVMGTSYNLTSALISKFDSNFNFVTSKSLTYTNKSAPYRSILAKSCSGKLNGTAIYAAVRFTGTPSSTPEVPTIIKFDTDLTYQWAYQGANLNFFYDVTSDSSSNCYVVTSYSTNSGATNYSGILKLNSSGTVLANTGYQLSGSSVGILFTAIASSSDGSSLAVCGGYTTGGNTGISVASVNSSGNIVWARVLYFVGSSYTGLSYSGSTAVTIDESTGDIYAALEQAYTETSWGGYAIFLVKYNSSGTLQWQRKIQASGDATYAVSGPTLSFANDMLRVCFGVGTFDEYGFYLHNPQVQQFPKDGSGTGSYTTSAYTYRYAEASLTALTPSVPSVTSGVTLSSASPTVTTVSQTVSESSVAREIINI